LNQRACSGLKGPRCKQLRQLRLAIEGQLRTNRPNFDLETHSVERAGLLRMALKSSCARIDSRSSSGRLFVLDLSGGRVFSLNPDGSDAKTLVTGCRLPDGLVVDSTAGYIYWTNMGVPHRNDGSIERADLDGGNRRLIIPEGGTFTPKQLHLEKKTGKLYWSDREGMRVMRASLDGSQVETLIQTGEGKADRHDPSNWCVGITVDPMRGQMYWTQKGADDSGHGRIFRASLDIPSGQTPTNRRDIEILFEGLPEPGSPRFPCNNIR